MSVTLFAATTVSTALGFRGDGIDCVRAGFRGTAARDDGGRTLHPAAVATRGSGHIGGRRAAAWQFSASPQSQGRYCSTMQGYGHDSSSAARSTSPRKPMWERWSTRVAVSVACMAATAVFVVVGDPEAESWHAKLHEFVYQVCVATLPVGPARAHTSHPGPGNSIVSVRSKPDGYRRPEPI